MIAAFGLVAVLAAGAATAHLWRRVVDRRVALRFPKTARGG